MEWVNCQPDQRNICVAFAGGVAEINDPELLGSEEDTDGQIAGSFLLCEKSRAPFLMCSLILSISLRISEWRAAFVAAEALPITGTAHIAQ